MPIETMEQYLYTYLTKKYGLKVRSISPYVVAYFLIESDCGISSKDNQWGEDVP